MESVKIEISTLNAAFGDYPHGEIGRILVILADKFNNGIEPSEAIMDYNGNRVGTVSITDTQDCSCCHNPGHLLEQCNNACHA